jgi:serine/threonine-protein kinase
VSRARNDAAAEELVGQMLDGRYRIEALLGRGGMGAVYRATHVNMDQRVAIKVLRPHLTGDATAARRLAREAKGTYKLETEHAVKVFDFGATESGLVYLVMELLDGRTVAEELAVDGAMAPARAVRIAAQLCDALAAAHRLGFIHRDIKPENVMLVKRGADADFVKVLDFGLAKLIEGAGASAFSVVALTQTDMVFGTPEYMAPEQAMGRTLDARADLYAVGATLFELLTGRPPFVDAAPMKLLAAHVRQPPPRLSDVRPEIASSPLESLLLRCLAKSPDQRPSSAASLATDLVSLLPTLSDRAPRVPAALASSETVDLTAPPPAPPSAPLTLATRGLRRSTRVTLIVIAAMFVAATALVLVATSRSTSRSAPDAGVLAAQVGPTFDAGVSGQVGPTSDAGVSGQVGPTSDAGVSGEVPRTSGRPKVKEVDPALEGHLKAAEAARRARNRLKQLAEADAALQVEPKSTRARFLLGEALLETGDAANGCKYLRQAKRVSEARALLASGRCPVD